MLLDCTWDHKRRAEEGLLDYLSWPVYVFVTAFDHQLSRYKRQVLCQISKDTAGTFQSEIVGSCPQIHIQLFSPIRRVCCFVRSSYVHYPRSASSVRH